MTEVNFKEQYIYCNQHNNTLEIRNMVKHFFELKKDVDYSILSFIFNTMLFYDNISVFKDLVLYAIENNIKSTNIIHSNITIWGKINFKQFLHHERSSMLKLNNNIQSFLDDLQD
jgi:hypothetical protein